MEKQNLREYELIREEMLSLKNCITNYMGFVIGGSGVAYYGLVSITNGSNSFSRIAYAPLFLSFIVTSVLLILFYKFNSHNRYAGYCKLLNQERLGNGKRLNKIKSVMAWETCIDKLRQSELTAISTEEEIKNINSWNISGLDKELIKFNIERYTRCSTISDKKPVRRGLKIFSNFLILLYRSDSWQFPIFIFTTFCIINILYLLIAIYFLVQNSPTMFIIVFSVFLILQIWIWLIFLGRLYIIMEGSRTVDAYCWRFISSRYKYIKKVYPFIDYSITTLKEDSIESIRKIINKCDCNQNSNKKRQKVPKIFMNRYNKEEWKLLLKYIQK